MRGRAKPPAATSGVADPLGGHAARPAGGAAEKQQPPPRRPAVGGAGRSHRRPLVAPPTACLLYTSPSPRD
eukprot:12495928-Alexandrium_andersonii.AAC.1